MFCLSLPSSARNSSKDNRLRSGGGVGIGGADMKNGGNKNGGTGIGPVGGLVVAFVSD